MLDDATSDALHAMSMKLFVILTVFFVVDVGLTKQTLKWNHCQKKLN